METKWNRDYTQLQKGTPNYRREVDPDLLEIYCDVVEVFLLVIGGSRNWTHVVTLR